MSLTQEHAAADALSAAERRHLLRRLAFTATAALDPDHRRDGYS